MGGARSTSAGRREANTGFWSGNSDRGDLEDPDEDAGIILKWMFKNWGMGAWTGLIWLRIGTGGGIF